MPEHLVINTPKAEFTEQDAHLAVTVMGLHLREFGPLLPSDIHRIIDIVGLSRGVKRNGRQQAALAIQQMLVPESGQETAILGTAHIEIPAIVKELPKAMETQGVAQAIDNICAYFNRTQV